MNGQILLAKRHLPLPQLMEKLGHGSSARKSALSPFRPESRASFSMFSRRGLWFWKDHGTGESGDEITYLEKYFSLTRSEAIRLFLRLANTRKI